MRPRHLEQLLAEVWTRYSEEILTLYAKGYPLLGIVPLPILSLKVKLPLNTDRRVGFESQNQSFIQTEQPPDGSISVITAGVAESVLLEIIKIP